MKELLPVLIAGLAPILLLGLILTGASLGLIAWQPPVLWNDQIGSSAPNSENSITSVSANGTAVYVAGYVGLAQSANGPTPSPSYAFLARYDENGGQVWSAKLGNPQYVGAGQLLARSEGVYFGLNDNGTVFIQKYDPKGNFVWSSQFGSPFGLRGQTVLSGGEGSVYAVSLGPANQNYTSPIIAAAYNPVNGSLVWTKTLRNESEIVQIKIFANADRLYVAGSGSLAATDTHAFFSGYETNGTLLWTDPFDGPNFTCYCEVEGISGDASGVYVAGSTLNTLPGLRGPGDFVRKYSLDGVELWTVVFSSPDYTGAFVRGISVSSSGVYLVQASSLHEFVYRFDTNGNLVWSFSSPRTPTNAISASQNSVYAAGGSSTITGDAFVERIGESSSLIFFGLNPPWSFVILVALAGLAASSILAFRRLRKTQHSASKNSSLARGSRLLGIKDF